MKRSILSVLVAWVVVAGALTATSPAVADEDDAFSQALAEAGLSTEEWVPEPSAVEEPSEEIAAPVDPWIPFDGRTNADSRSPVSQAPAGSSPPAIAPVSPEVPQTDAPSTGKPIPTDPPTPARTDETVAPSAPPEEPGTPADEPPVTGSEGSQASEEQPLSTDDAQVLPDQAGATAVPGLYDYLGELPSYSFHDFTLFGAQDGIAVRVNVATGNLLIRDQVGSFAGPGIPVALQRVYNSNSDVAGDFGTRWRSSVGSTGVVVNAAGASLFTETGARLDFLLTGTTFTPKPGVNATLVKNLDGSWVSQFDRTGDLWTFNAAGWPLSHTDRNGVGVTFGYAANGDRFLTDAAGKRITVEYMPASGPAYSGTIDTVSDSVGRLATTNIDTYTGNRLMGMADLGDTSTWAMTYDSTNRLVSMNRDGKSIAFEYANPTQISRVTESRAGEANIVTQFAYSGSQTTVTDPRGGAAVFTIDSNYRVVSTKDQLNRIRSQTWTANGDVETITDAFATGNTTTTTYDALNNPTGVTIPTGAGSQAAFALGATCPNAQAGNAHLPKCVTNANGATREYTYDGVGNRLTSTDTTPGGSGATQTYTYDVAAGTVCGGKAGQVCSSTDGNGKTTSYHYTNGNLDAVTPPAPLGVTRYDYDAAGRVTKVTDGLSHATTYGYDTADRIVKTTWANGQTQLNAYNVDGSTKSQSDSGARVVMTYTYNLLGHQTQKKIAVTAGAYGLASTIDMSYDASGNLASYKDETGTTAYAYDAANQLISVTEPGGSCGAGAPAASSGCIKFAHDANGAETSRIFPGGASTTTTRDASGRAISIVATNGANAVSVSISYSYDQAGTDRAVIQTRTSVKEQGIPANAVTSYTYDSKNHVTKAEEKDGTTLNASWQYAYDPVGNRTSQTRAGATGATAGTINYTYNAVNQISSTTADTATWSYDAVGNQTRNGITGATTTYGDRGQATTFGSTAQSYFGQGNTERLSTSGTTTSYSTSALGLAQTKRNTGTIDSYTRTGGGDLISYKAGSGSTRHYYITDSLGSVVGMFAPTGGFEGGYSYSPYGEARFTSTNTAATQNTQRYIAGQLDQASTYKLGARYYDTSIGRFTQMDPSGKEANPYAYAGCNPINAKDPTGLDCETVYFLEGLLIDIALAFAFETIGASIVAGLIADSVLYIVSRNVCDD